MKNIRKLVKENSAGALLFTIVFVFLLSFASAALFVLMNSQCKMIYAEIDNIQDDYFLQAGVAYAYDKLANGDMNITWTVNVPIPDDNTDTKTKAVTVTYNKDTKELLASL
jgi:hypothetical protein